jgi:ELWxxDGT repeat protein
MIRPLIILMLTLSFSLVLRGQVKEAELVKDIGNPGNNAPFKGYILASIQDTVYTLFEDKLYKIEDGVNAEFLDSIPQSFGSASYATATANTVFVQSPFNHLCRVDGITGVITQITNDEIAFYQNGNPKYPFGNTFCTNDSIYFIGRKNDVLNIWLSQKNTQQLTQVTFFDTTDDVSSIFNLQIMNNRLVFSGSIPASSNTALYSTDGTPTGLKKIADLSAFPNVGLMHKGLYYFIAKFQSNILELVQSDGTAGGTQKVAATAGIECDKLSLVGDAIYLGRDQQLGRLYNGVYAPIDLQGYLILPDETYDLYNSLINDGERVMLVVKKDGINQLPEYMIVSPDSSVIWPSVPTLGRHKVYGFKNQALIVLASDGLYACTKSNCSPIYLAPPLIEFVQFFVTELLTSSRLFINPSRDGQFFPLQSIRLDKSQSDVIRYTRPTSEVSSFTYHNVDYVKVTRLSNGQLYFLSNDGSIPYRTGNNLWTTDGTSDGTKLVYEFGNKVEVVLYPIGDKIIIPYFNNEFSPRFSLLTFNGITMDTIFEKDDVTSFNMCANIGLKTYFIVNKTDLWRTDGTNNGTVFIDSIAILKESTLNYYIMDSAAIYMLTRHISTGQYSIIRLDASTQEITYVAQDIPVSIGQFPRLLLVSGHFAYQYLGEDGLSRSVIPGIADFKSTFFPRLAAVTSDSALVALQVPSQYKNKTLIWLVRNYQSILVDSLNEVYKVQIAPKTKETIFFGRTEWGGVSKFWKLKNDTVLPYYTFSDTSYLYLYYIGNFPDGTMAYERHLDDGTTDFWKIGVDSLQCQQFGHFIGNLRSRVLDGENGIIKDSLLLFWGNTPELGSELWKIIAPMYDPERIPVLKPGQILILPNPCFQEARIVLPESLNDAAGYRMEIVDVRGVLCQTWETTGQQTIFNRQKLPAGIYLVLAKDSKGVIKAKAKLVLR